MSERPLNAILIAALEAQTAAEAALNGCGCDEMDCAHLTTVREAEEAVEAARMTLAASSEPRSWKLYEEGYHYHTIEAGSSREALSAAKNGVDPTNYPGVGGKGRTYVIWVAVRVECEATCEQDSATVACNPEASSRRGVGVQLLH